MIAGHNSIDLLTDLKYNVSSTEISRLAKIKKAFKSEAQRYSSIYHRSKQQSDLDEYNKFEYMANEFERSILPGVYNIANGYESQSAFFDKNGNIENSVKRAISDEADILGAFAKTKNGGKLENVINALEQRYGNIQIEDLTKQDQKEMSNAIASNVKSLEEQQPDDTKKPDNPIKNFVGYKRMEEWMSKINRTISKKKKHLPIEQVSQLQKVSPVEFAKPRALLLNKLMNRELYCKRYAEEKRFMYVMTDGSGSMSSYRKWRDFLISKMFEDCKKLDIAFEHTFWDDNLKRDGFYGPQSIKSMQELEKFVLTTSGSGGGTDMGQSTLQKLNLLDKANTKKYLVVISDGDGRIDDVEAVEIKRICKSKNVDLKFALFTDHSGMGGLNEEDIFNIYY